MEEQQFAFERHGSAFRGTKFPRSFDRDLQNALLHALIGDLCANTRQERAGTALIVAAGIGPTADTQALGMNDGEFRIEDVKGHEFAPGLDRRQRARTSHGPQRR